jgi:hypothetical protein
VRIHAGFGGAIVITVECWDYGQNAYIGNSVTVTVANDVTCKEMCGDREPTLAVVVQLVELFGVTVMEFLEPAKKPPRRGKKK